MNAPLDLLTPIAVLGCGLVAGIFFGFSTFIMRALGRLPPSEGIAAISVGNRDSFLIVGESKDSWVLGLIPFEI